MLIREFLPSDIPLVKAFTDQCVGQGYYTEDELRENQKKSISSNGKICSFVLEDNGKIKGLRLAYPAGNWQHGKGHELRTDLWPTSLDKTAYFQSLFVAPDLQGQGWGPKLSAHSLAALKQLGTEGIITHSWKESPNNSSYRYLNKLGFQIIAEHPDYWINVDYTCPRDGRPCRCTAIEMHLDLRKDPL